MKSKYRLKKNAQFSAIYNKGAYIKGKTLTVVYAKGNKTPKFGFSVSKKFAKACKRNRAKRQLKECVNRLFCRIDKKYNYVIIARQGLGEDFSKILSQLTFLLDRCGLLSEDIQ